MKYILNLSWILFIAILTISCSSDDDNFTPSQIDTSEGNLTELDLYLREAFTSPYNIEIQYKWDINEVEESRFLHPPRLESVKPMANALHKIWVESYTEVGGDDFIKRIAPRQITFVGSYDYNESGTHTTGLAEAGTKVTLFNIDYIDYDDFESIRRPMKTIHHEYTHILNQQIPFDTDFNSITPEGYTDNWSNYSNKEANELGFITNYSTKDPKEDFAEMVAIMLTRSKAEYEDILNGIEDEEAVEKILEKEAMIREYFSKEYDIDFEELRLASFQNVLEVTQ